ncbi:MAG: hypothetical protein RSB55_09600, partial [Oscillospiraceae bacterium]
MWEGTTLNITKESTGTLEAIGNNGSAGIGGDYNYNTTTYHHPGTINIEGGTVTAFGGADGAGIGGGYHSNGGAVTISGGTVTATSGTNGAGIGGGDHSTNGTVTISGGTVTVTPFNYGASIGGGYMNKGGTVTIDGNAVVFATPTGRDSIGNGAEGKGATVYRKQGIVFKGNTGNVYGNVTLQDNLTLPGDKNLTISSGNTLTIPKDITFTSNAILFLDGGSIAGDGTIKGNRYFETSITSEDIADIPDQVYHGTAITPAVTVKSPRNILGQNFMVTTAGFTKSYENNEGIGIAKVVYTRLGYPTVEKPFNIVKSGTTFESLATYIGTTPAKSFTYGETITVRAKPKATGTAANGAKALTPPGDNQMALFLGDTQISDAMGPDRRGEYIMTYNTTGKVLPPGYNTITAKYVGNDTMADATGDVSVT